MTLYALVDCNNFYASCERAFQPKLEGKPIIVLSNNDGCVIARSQEARALGIKMGVPYFQVKKICTQYNVHVFSSNFQLYGDMSSRIMESLESFSAHVDIYSIDEAFLSFPSHSKNLEYLGENIKNNLYKWTGIPVSIGFAPTKTLAKLANHIAKTKTTKGIFSLTEPHSCEAILRQFPIKDVWGIGYKWQKKLRQNGILTAWDFINAPSAWVRQHFSVIGQRVQMELQGISCLGESGQPAEKKNILTSRSFGKAVRSLPEIEEAIANYTACACQKLRRQHSYTQAIYVFLRTHKFYNREKYYRLSTVKELLPATNDTRYVIHMAKQAVRDIFKPGYDYAKAGIMLLQLTSEKHQQDMLSPKTSENSQKLLSIVDQYNKKWGSQTMYFLGQGHPQQRHWKKKQKYGSPRYTTSWHDILKVH